MQDDARRIWDAVLGELQLQVTRHNFDTYLRDTVGLELAHDRLMVGVPNDYAIAWLCDRAYPLIVGAVGKVLGRTVEVSFQLRRPQGRPSEGGVLFRATPLEAPPPTPPPHPRLNPKFTFERFVVGPHCRLAVHAALEVAQRPSEAPNPLYIFGPPGMGKTHLLSAIGHRLAAQRRHILYITAEQFTSDFVAAVGQRRVEEFRHRYRHLDALLVDDVHLLAGKERTQEEFYHIFNHVFSEGGQIMVTADRPPHAIAHLDPHLRSRLEGGLVVDIGLPDLETKAKVACLKAREMGVQLPPAVAHYMAEMARRSIRELEGYLNRVVAYARLVQRGEIDMQTAQEALTALTEGAAATPPSPQTVLRTVAQFFNLPPQALAGKARSKLVADARHIAMYLLREECQLSLKDIGRLLGDRDHSTVIHGVNKVETLIRTDPLLRRQLSEIRSLLSPGHAAQATA